VFFPVQSVTFHEADRSVNGPGIRRGRFAAEIQEVQWIPSRVASVTLGSVLREAGVRRACLRRVFDQLAAWDQYIELDLPSRHQYERCFGNFHQAARGDGQMGCDEQNR